MKLTLKLVGFLVLVVILLLAGDLILSVQRETHSFHEDMKKDALILGTSIREWVTDVWERQGEEAALQWVERSNPTDSPIKIRWVWLDESFGTAHRPVVGQDKLLQGFQQESVFWHQIVDDGKEILYTYLKIATVDHRRPGALEISEPFSPIQQYTQQSTSRRLLLMLLIVLLSAVTTGILGMVVVGKPLQQLVDKAKRVGQGKFDEPVVLRGHDELAELGNAINAMSQQLKDARETSQVQHRQRIEVLEQLRHADRLRTVGELASGLAHELGTPLNVISGRASLIVSEKLAHSEVLDSAQIIHGQTERMTKIIRQLLDYARRRQPLRETVHLQNIGQQTVELLTPLMKKKNISLQLRTHQDNTVKVDASQIQQVLTNLVINALHASSAGDGIEIEIDQTLACRPDPTSDRGDTTPWKCATIAVQDHGLGIEKKHQTRLFEPFYTTKEAGQGSGLGLSIVQGIVQEHGGWIEVESSPGQGSRFTIYLPQETEPSVQHPASCGTL